MTAAAAVADGGGLGGAITFGATKVVTLDASTPREVARLAPMLSIVSTVEVATSEPAEPSFVTVTSASTVLGATVAVTVEPSVVERSESLTLGAAMLDDWVVFISCFTVNEVAARLRREGMRRNGER